MEQNQAAAEKFSTSSVSAVQWRAAMLQDYETHQAKGHGKVFHNVLSVGRISPGMTRTYCKALYSTASAAVLTLIMTDLHVLSNTDTGHR